MIVMTLIVMMMVMMVMVIMMSTIIMIIMVFFPLRPLSGLPSYLPLPSSLLLNRFGGECLGISEFLYFHKA